MHYYLKIKKMISIQFLKTTKSKQYIITPKYLNKKNTVIGWYELASNKWEFYDSYKDTKTIGWHKADINEWVHNDKDIAGDIFHLNNDGIMDYGWYRDVIIIGCIQTILIKKKYMVEH